MPAKKRIAIVAHDNRKDELVEFLMQYKETLKNHTLCGTGTTSRLVSEKIGLEVYGYLSGPLGGDLQIGAKIATNEIDLLIFFWDPLEAQPHDPDVKALLRISVLYDIPIITNEMTGKYLFNSDLLSQSYCKKINIR